MLNLYGQAFDLLARLRASRDGVVSFEYIIVAVCIITAVGVAFGPGTGSVISAALTTGIGYITAAFATAAT